MHFPLRKGNRKETQSGGRVEVTQMGTGGLFATCRHSRLRRVRVVAGCATLRLRAIREGEAGQACVAAVQPNFALPKLQTNVAAAKSQPRVWKPSHFATKRSNSCSSCW